MKLNILIPLAGSFAAKVIAPKSAIVADPAASGDRLICHYEGNLYGAENLQNFYERICSAAGRLTASYPTAAMGEFEASDFMLVAEFDTTIQVVTAVHDVRALEAWTGEPAANTTGIALPIGDAEWDVAAQAAVGARNLEGEQTRFRTRAGQIIDFDMASRRARVFPGVPDPVPAAEPGPSL